MPSLCCCVGGDGGKLWTLSGPPTLSGGRARQRASARQIPHSPPIKPRARVRQLAGAPPNKRQAPVVRPVPVAQDSNVIPDQQSGLLDAPQLAQEVCGEWRPTRTCQSR